MTRVPARSPSATRTEPSCGTLLRNGTMGLPQASHLVLVHSGLSVPGM